MPRGALGVLSVPQLFLAGLRELATSVASTAALKKAALDAFRRELRVAAARGSVLLSFTRELRVSQLRVLCSSCSYAAVASLRVVSTRVKQTASQFASLQSNDVLLHGATRSAKSGPALRVLDTCQALLKS